MLSVITLGRAVILGGSHTDGDGEGDGEGKGEGDGEDERDGIISFHSKKRLLSMIGATMWETVTVSP